MSEQPAPTTSPWSQVVDGPAESSMLATMQFQRRKGVETYGTPLQSFNGRDGYDDAMSELADAAAYVTQIEAERQAWAWRYRSVRDDIEVALEHLLAGRNGDATRVLARALEYGLP